MCDCIDLEIVELLIIGTSYATVSSDARGVIYLRYT